MTAETFIKPELGKITHFLDVPELIVRTVTSSNSTSEPGGDILNDDQDDQGDRGTCYEDRLQGRLVNSTTHKLSDVKHDLSYYDGAGTFLGLNKSAFLEEDELDVNDQLPLDMKVELPEGTARCVFNARAKKPGLIGKMFWG